MSRHDYIFEPGIPKASTPSGNFQDGLDAPRRPTIGRVTPRTHGECHPPCYGPRDCTRRGGGIICRLDRKEED